MVDVVCVVTAAPGMILVLELMGSMVVIAVVLAVLTGVVFPMFVVIFCVVVVVSTIMGGEGTEGVPEAFFPVIFLVISRCAGVI